MQIKLMENETMSIENETFFSLRDFAITQKLLRCARRVIKIFMNEWSLHV